MTDAQNIADAAADQTMLDRALVAVAYGWHKGGPGQRAYPAGDCIYRLARTGAVNMEISDYGSTLVWLTEDGHGILADIEAEGQLDTHLAAIRKACEFTR